MHNKIKQGLVGLTMSAGLVLGGALVSTSPAEANVSQGTFCEPVGWTTHWKAKKFYDGEFYGYGPIRWTRKGAWNDCYAFMG